MFFSMCRIKFVLGAQDHHEADKEGELVHQHPDVKSDKPKPGTPSEIQEYVMGCQDY